MPLKHIALRRCQLLQLIQARREDAGRLDIDLIRRSHLSGHIGLLLRPGIHALAVLNHQIPILLPIGFLLSRRHFCRIVIKPGPLHIMNHIGGPFLQNRIFTLLIHLANPNQ